MIEHATPESEAQVAFQVRPKVPLTTRLPTGETGWRRKKLQTPVRRSGEFLVEIEALPLPDVAVAQLHELQRNYSERFGTVPPWVLAQTHAEQLQVIADAMRNDQELDGGLLDVYTSSQPLELESLGEPSSPLAALQRQYAERFGSMPLWLFHCAPSEQRMLLSEALVEN